MSQRAATGPDFVCIGMGKSGTGWLYDQLLHHPQFWMPPIKELHYLDREIPRIRTADKKLANRERQSYRVADESLKRLVERDIAFLEAVKAVRKQRMDLELYAGLYRFKGEQMTGDISPSYCAMDEELIARILARFQGLKIILLLRDPVARAWSHFTMKQRTDRLDEFILHDPARFRESLDKSKVFRTGAPALIVRKWRKLVPEARFRHYFFDDLVTDPVGLRRNVLTFLGADPERESALDPRHNRKGSKTKLEMSAQIKAILVEKFAEELREAATLLGGHAAQWAEKYGV
jgi:hypothetical protein